MGRVLPKKLFRGLRVTKGGGLLQTIVGGVIGGIALSLGADIYHRLTRGKRKDTPEAETEDR